MSSPEASEGAKFPLRDRRIEEISSILLEVLGSARIAYAIQERESAKIHAFARSEVTPGERAESDLRDLAEVTETLLDRYDGSRETVRAIMIGANPMLDGQAAFEVFHDGQSERVVSVARYL